MASEVISAVQSFADYALVVVGLMIVYYFVLMISFPFRNHDRGEIGLTEWGKNFFRKKGKGENRVPPPFSEREIPPAEDEEGAFQEQAESLREEWQEVVERLKTMGTNFNLRLGKVEKQLEKSGQGFTPNDEQIVELRKQLGSVEEEIRRETTDIVDFRMREIVQKMEILRRKIFEKLQEFNRLDYSEKGKNLPAVINEVRSLDKQVRTLENSIMEFRRRLEEELRKLQAYIEELERQPLARQTIREIGQESRKVKEGMEIIVRDSAIMAHEPVDRVLDNCVRVINDFKRLEYRP